MARLTGVNTFDSGMIKDMHPMMVPNTVLTDCLNGTLITHNGNEFALQNDMGNYAFKYGALSNGFVPVGMKEHGGILYIVSYNPIDNRVEIGSFPSQKTIFNTITSDTGNRSLEIIELSSDKFQKYTYLMEKYSKICIFSKEETFFLNPGDKYILGVESNGSYYKTLEELNAALEWQHLTPYILTDENKLYNVNGYVEIQQIKEVVNRDDFKPITWDIPGWLAVQFTIDCMEEFNAYFGSTNSSAIKIEKVNGQYPKGVTEEEIRDHEGEYKISPSGTLKLQTFWDNRIYKQEKIDSIINNIRFIFYNDIDEVLSEQTDKYEITKKLSGDESKALDYNSMQDIIYHNENSLYQGYKYVVPALEIDNKFIIYDQFETNIQLTNTYINPEKINIADDIYKYYTDSNSLTLTFNYDSFPGVKLAYQLKRYVDPCQYSDEEYVNRISGEDQFINVYKDLQFLEEVNYNGQNVLDITFTTESEYNTIKYLDEDSKDNKYQTYTNNNTNSEF